MRGFSKKLIANTPLLGSLIFFLFPFSYMISPVFGYGFVLYHAPLTMAGIAVLLCAGTIALVTQKFSLNKTNLAFSAVLLPVTLLNGLFFVFGATWWISVIFVLVACVCAFVIFLYYAAPRWLKIMSSVLSVFVFLILLLTIAMSALFHAFGDFGSNTVVKALLSPDGAHVARVVDSDQGALGGETFVEVESTAGAVPVFLGEFKPVPVRIYTGDWGEYMDMEIFWKGNDAVIINGKEYRIFKYW